MGQERLEYESILKYWAIGKNYRKQDREVPLQAIWHLISKQRMTDKNIITTYFVSRSSV
jgi:hypothetical protein